MLSAGEYHKLIPKDPEGNLRYRLWLIEQCKQPNIRRAVEALCRQDILFYINSFVWQYNPRMKGGGEIGPFITWDFQDEAILAVLLHITNDEDLLIEKSREMGASWLCLIIMDWLSLFFANLKFLCISHSEKAVDEAGNSDCLFWKIQFMHKYLPEWLRGKVRKKKLAFQYPNGSSITGAATSERSGVGGRATAVFLDEFSKQPEAKAILGQTADVGCRIFNGTHYGTDTEFFVLTQRPDLHKLVMHWSQHPKKNPGLYRSCLKNGIPDVLDRKYAFPPDYRYILDGTPSGGPFHGIRSVWYDGECTRRNDSRAVAMHLDINAEGTVSQFFDPILIRTLQEEYCMEPLWVGDLYYDRDSARPVELIKTPGGPLALWMLPNYRDKVPFGEYAFGADICSGMGATNSCLSGGNCKTGEKIAAFVSPTIDPEDFACLAVAMCWLFKNEDGEPAMLVWEMQGPGAKFGKKVIELGFRNIYYRTDEKNPVKKRLYQEPGWFPNNDNKRILMEDYRRGLQSRQIANRCKIALDECLFWAYTAQGVEHSGGIKTADPSGAGVNHGDRSVADALLWLLMRGRGQQLKKEEEERIIPGTLGWRRMLVAQHESSQGGW